MKVEHNGLKYHVQFIKQVERRTKGHATIKTICKLFGDNISEKVLLGVGIARQCFRDKYDQKIGKKIAMSRAAEALPRPIRLALAEAVEKI